MKKILLQIFIIFLTIPVFGQYPTFRIDYKFLFDEALLAMDESEMSEEQIQIAATTAIAMAFLDSDQPIAQVWVNKRYVRAKSNPISNNYGLLDKEKQQYFEVYPDSKEYYVSNNIKDKILDLGDSIKLASELPITFDNHQTKVIAGYDCKLATIHLTNDKDKNSSIQVWYNEYLPTAYWGEYAYLNKIPGAAMEISTLGLGIQATKIQSVGSEIGVKFFSIPDDYKEVSDPKEEFGLGFFGNEENDSLGLYQYDLGDGRIAILDQTTNLYDLKDENGNIRSTQQFSSIGSFNDNISIVTDNGYNYGAIDIEGKIIIPTEYSYLAYNPDDKTYLFTKDDKFGVLDNSGKIIIPNKYDYITYFNKEGNAIVTEGDKYGIINNKNKIIVPVKYPSITDLNGDSFIGEEKDKYSLYNLQGVKKATYDYITTSNENNIFIVISKKKYGYINEEGKIIIPIKYEYASTFEDGIAEVILSDLETTKYINTKGEFIEKYK